MSYQSSEVILINYAFSMFRGGGENFDYNIYLSLKKRGYKCKLITVKPLFLKFSPIIEKNINTKYIKGFWFYGFASYLKSLNKNLSKIAYLIRIIGQISFEILVFFYLFKKGKKYKFILSCGLPLITFLASKILKINSIMRAPGPFPTPYEKLFYPHINIVANGDAYRRLEKIYPNNIKYLEIGVDQSLSPINKKTLKGRPINMAFVGRLIPIKGILQLLDILKLVNDLYPLKLHIFGDGSLKDQIIKNSIKLKMEKNIILHGSLNKDDLFESLGKLDCLLSNSIYDNFPNALIEANAIGLPICGPNVGGIDLIIRNKINGIIFEPHISNIEKANSIFEFINLIIDGSFKSSKISEDCKKKFNWENTSYKLINIAQDKK